MIAPTIRLSLAVASMLALAGQATAQSDMHPAKASATDAAAASKADQPVTAVVTEPDAQLQRVLASLTGSFVAQPDADRPGLVLNSAAVNIPELPGAVHFEIARADAPADPFRAGLFWAYRRKGEMRLRVFDYPATSALRETLVGVCFAPDAFPAMDASLLAPNVDLPLTENSGTCEGATPVPLPTMRDGAIELTSSVRITPSSISFNDRGFDAQGRQVWGPTSDLGVTFARAAAPSATVARPEGGLIIITLVEPKPDAPKLVEGGELTVHYTGWLTNGTKFDSSRQPGREPFRIRIPGGVIKGWNEGLKNMAKGERRRLIIPAAMAYGERGAGRGLIPPNSTLIFDVECLHVDNTNPTPPPQTPPSGAQPSTQPATQPANSSTPIGKPATGSQPEQPR